jgi:hypothetical protein
MKDKNTTNSIEAIALTRIIVLVMSVIVMLKFYISNADTITYIGSMFFMSSTIALIMIQTILILLITSLNTKFTIPLMIIVSILSELLISLYIGKYFVLGITQSLDIGMFTTSVLFTINKINFYNNMKGELKHGKH